MYMLMPHRFIAMGIYMFHLYVNNCDPIMWGKVMTTPKTYDTYGGDTADEESDNTYGAGI